MRIAKLGRAKAFTGIHSSGAVTRTPARPETGDWRGFGRVLGARELFGAPKGETFCDIFRIPSSPLVFRFRSRAPALRSGSWARSRGKIRSAGRDFAPKTAASRLNNTYELLQPTDFRHVTDEARNELVNSRLDFVELGS